MIFTLKCRTIALNVTKVTLPSPFRVNSMEYIREKLGVQTRRECVSHILFHGMETMREVTLPCYLDQVKRQNEQK